MYFTKIGAVLGNLHFSPKGHSKHVSGGLFGNFPGICLLF